MSEFITQTARLVPYAKRPKQVPSFVTAYSHEPLPDDPAANLGNLFAVVEVLVSGRSSEEVTDLIIETIGDHYYHNEASDPLARLEAAIKATNHQLVEYVNQGNAAWIGKLSAVVAVLADDQLHVAQTGSAEAILYRGKASTRVAGGQTSAKPAVPSKTFSALASGRLEAGDRLLLATPALVHQISLDKLGHIIADNSPNHAIAELTELLPGPVSERVAALVVEITTPALAALQVRSDQPAEIKLGTPATPLAAAKMAAAPLTAATVTTGKQLHHMARSGWSNSKPHLHHGALAVVKMLRRALTGRGSRRRLIIAAVIVLMVVGGSWWWRGQQQQTQQLVDRYQGAYQQYLLASQAADDGDKAGARTLLQRLQTRLADLSKNKSRPTLEAKLKKTALLEGEPSTVAGLATLVAARLDTLDNLARATPTSVATLANLGTGHASLMQLVGGKAYIITGPANPSLRIVTVATGAASLSAANLAPLGQIVAATVSSAGDGLYLLTSKPGVWFYRFAGDSLTAQTIALGAWPAATAIASYNGNLYLLGTGAMYKHTRTPSGWSPKTTYLSQTQTNGLDGATSLAVDGLVYLLSPSGLRQYSVGALQRTGTIPQSLADAVNLRASTDGKVLVATSASAGRVGLWTVTNSAVTFTKQYQLNGNKTLTDAVYDAKTGLVYALANDKLVTFKP